MTNKHDFKEVFKSVLLSEAKSIERVAALVDDAQILKLISIFEDIKKNNGKMVVSGIGKSGVIAMKISSTLSSLGLASIFLHPTEALHGDLGRVSDNDAIILLSKSGTTEEITKLLPYLNMDRSRIIGLVGNTHSTIAQKCGLVFDCSVESEACINNQAPTNSSTVALAMGDAISVVYESWVGLSKEGFAQNHPGGLLGKSLSLKVKDVMIGLDQCAQVSPDQLLKDVLIEMTAKPLGLCFVLDKGMFQGIIVEGDIRRAFTKSSDALSFKASELMNSNPFKLQSCELAFEALKRMESGSKQISVMPVFDNERIVGLIRLHDLLREGLA